MSGKIHRKSSYHWVLRKLRLKSFLERPTIARGIGTLNYFERLTGTVVLESFLFGLGLRQLLVLSNI